MCFRNVALLIFVIHSIAQVIQRNQYIIDNPETYIVLFDIFSIVL